MKVESLDDYVCRIRVRWNLIRTIRALRKGRGEMRAIWRGYAISMVQRAIGKGEMVRASNSGLACVDCGCPAQIWEHRDYEKPLMVEPCCQRCNLLRGPAKHPMHLPPYGLTTIRRDMDEFYRGLRSFRCAMTKQKNREMADTTEMRATA